MGVFGRTLRIRPFPPVLDKLSFSRSVWILLFPSFVSWCLMKSSSNLVLLFALTLTLSPVLGAQTKEGDTLVAAYPQGTTGGGIYLVDRTKGSLSALTGVSGDLKWAYSLDQDPWNPTAFYVGTTGADQSPASTPNLYRILATAGKVLKATKLNSVALTGDKRILDMDVVGSELYFITNARIARIPLKGGNPTTVVKFSSFQNVPRNPVMGSDGRYLFTNFDSKGSGPDSCYRVDPQNLKSWKKIYSPQAPFRTNLFSIEPGADGQVLVLDKGGFTGPDLSFVDPISGKASKKLRFFPPHFQVWKSVEDAKNRDLIVLGTSRTGDQVSIWRGGKLLKGPFGAKLGNLRGATIRQAPWLARFGYACAASVTEPRLLANGQPRKGNTNYALLLKAPGLRGGIALLGIHGRLPSPIQLSFVGMGKCELGVLPLLSFPIAIPATGTLSLGFPIPSAAPSMNLDFQAVLLDSKANTAGLITTQVGGIILR